MTEDQDIFINNKVRFRVKTKTDLSTATLLELHIYRPDGTLEKLTGTIDPLNDTQFTAVTVTGVTPTLNEEGDYMAQAYMEDAGGEPIHGKIFNFNVLTPLEEL